MQQCTSVPGTAAKCTLTAPLTVIYESKPKHTNLTTEIGDFILDIVVLWILNTKHSESLILRE